MTLCPCAIPSRPVPHQPAMTPTPQPSHQLPSPFVDVGAAMMTRWNIQLSSGQMVRWSFPARGRAAARRTRRHHTCARTFVVTPAKSPFVAHGTTASGASLAPTSLPGTSGRTLALGPLRAQSARSASLGPTTSTSTHESTRPSRFQSFLWSFHSACSPQVCCCF
jgi:hypothetical protein